jgi:hypothetical protein
MEAKKKINKTKQNKTASVILSPFFSHSRRAPFHLIFLSFPSPPSPPLPSRPPSLHSSRLLHFFFTDIDALQTNPIRVRVIKKQFFFLQKKIFFSSKKNRTEKKKVSRIASGCLGHPFSKKIFFQHRFLITLEQKETEKKIGGCDFSSVFF